MKRRSIYFLVSLFFATFAAPEGLTSPFQSNKVVEGNWTLTKVGDTDGRTIKFVIDKTQLKGTYLTRQGEEKPISGARFNRRYLYFKVPDLQLYFEMRLVGDHFEGKMTVYSTTEKRAPEPVRMTRQNRLFPCLVTKSEVLRHT